MKRARWAAAFLVSGCAAPQTPLGGATEANRLLAQTTARTGDLRIKCTPDDATVVLDGVPVGLCSDFTPTRGLSVGQGRRRLEVQKTGFLPYQSIVETDGTRLSLNVSLAPSSL